MKESSLQLTPVYAAYLHPQLGLLPPCPALHTHHLLQAGAGHEVWAQRLYLHFDHCATPAAAPGSPFSSGQLKRHMRLEAGLAPLLHIVLLWVTAQLCDIQAEPNQGAGRSLRADLSRPDTLCPAWHSPCNVPGWMFLTPSCNWDEEAPHSRHEGKEMTGSVSLDTKS